MMKDLGLVKLRFYLCGLCSCLLIYEGVERLLSDKFIIGVAILLYAVLLNVFTFSRRDGEL